MFVRALRQKPGAQLKVTLASAHLPVRLGHRRAEEIFAEPLKTQLAATGRGVVIDCHADETAPGEVTGVTLALGLTDPSRDGLGTVARMLEHLRAPLGSSLRLVDGICEPYLFGVTEGLELSVATKGAPDADARRRLAVIVREAISEIAVSRGWADRGERTLFWFYGEDFAEMQARLGGIIGLTPALRGATLRRMA